MDNSYFNWKQKQQEVDLGPFTPPDGVPPFIRTKETGDKVYLVKDGYAHWITSPEVLQAVGGDFGKIETIDRSIFRQLRIAEKITLESADAYKLDPQEPTHKVDAPEVNEKPEFKQYEEPEIPSAPKSEPIKGLTSIIIPVYWVHYPAFHYTGNCIGSIREHTDKEKTPYEIILVINGKTGITVDKLEQTYADKVIQNEENEGFAKAVNKGIRCASGEYIAIVNNDVQVFDHWLEDFQEALSNGLDLVMATPMYGMPFARAVEAEELREKSTIRKFLVNGSEVDVNTLVARQNGLIQVNREQEVKELNPDIRDSFSDFKDFSCVLTHKAMFDQIGLFDEQFFMYGEDLDLMRRMEKEGLKLASTKRVNTAHIIGATSSAIDEMPEIMNESKAKLKAKWGC